MTANVKFASAAPEGASNGLVAILEKLIQEDGIHTCIVQIRTETLTTKVRTHAVIPTVLVTRIEPMIDEDQAFAAIHLMLDAYHNRTTTGDQLPVDDPDDEDREGDEDHDDDVVDADLVAIES